MMRNTLLAISCGGVIIHLNHRGVFNRFLFRLGLLDKSVDILRAVDKLAKIGRDAERELLSESVGESSAGEILNYIEISGSFNEKLLAMTEAAGQGPETERLKQIGKFIQNTGIEDSIVLDPSITRGLDYYTGVVFESFLADLPSLGSVCSGGRYDNLVGLYSADQRAALCGVGASIGIDRLIAGLEALGRLKEEKSYAKTAVAWVSPDAGGACQAIADKLRSKGIPCEVFLNEEKLTKQFQLSEKKGLSWLIIPNSENPLGSPLTLRDLIKRENKEGLGIEKLVEIIKDEAGKL